MGGEKGVQILIFPPGPTSDDYENFFAAKKWRRENFSFEKYGNNFEEM